MQRHPARRCAVHGPAARADDKVGLVGQNGADEVAHLRRVVGPVRLHEDDRPGAASRSGAGAGEARIAVASPRFAQQCPAGRGDQRGAAVGRAIVDEERAAEQTEAAQLGQQSRQSRGLVEHRHDDEVVWAL